jgi:hypothetical protein
MAVPSLDSPTPGTRRLRRLQALAPVALFLIAFAAAGGLAATIGTRSPLLIALAATVMVSSFAGLAGWVVITDRRPTSPPPSHVPWSEEDWSRFDRSLSAYIRRQSDPSGPPWSDLDEA